jgi:hypothetical protein
MSMDWLKVEKHTASKPEVLAIAAKLGITPDDAFGKCFRFWAWADSHLTDGNARGVTKLTIDTLIGAQGFADAMLSVGWLEFTTDGVRIPGFSRHMSQSAKTRALTSRRVAWHKERRANANAETNAYSVSESLPTALPRTRTRSNTRSTSTTTTDSIESSTPVEVDQGGQQREPDPKAVQLRASELMQQLPETADDTRFVTQVAWLIEAGVPIAAVVQDALNGVRAINPDHPVRYLQTCIANKIGREQFAAMRRKAPPCKRLSPAERPPTIGAAQFGLNLQCPPP